jgi:hypothetical protein
MKSKNKGFLNCGIVVFTTISLMFQSVVNAQSTRYLNPSLVPESGKSTQDFVHQVGRFKIK